MANPKPRDKCAKATAAMRLEKTLPRGNQIGGKRPPRSAEGEGGQGSINRIGSLLFRGGLLALGAELLALLAVKSLGVGLLGTFQ